MGSTEDAAASRKQTRASSPAVHPKDYEPKNAKDDGKHCSSSVKQPAPQALESIGTSASRLAYGLAICFAAMQVFDQSQFRRCLSSTLESAMRALPPYATAIVPALVYVACVLWHLYVRTDESKLAAQKATESKQGCTNRVLVAWNYFLMVFSMVMFTAVVPKSLQILHTHGIRRYLCDGNLQWDATPTFDVGYLARICMFSKFVELFDTALLIIRGRDIPFLHWYHHASVLLYTWLTTLTLYPSNAFGLVNTGVHSIMYYYYARAAQGVRLGMAKVVTQVQMAQMVIGMLLSGLLIFLHLTLPEGQCTGGKTIQANGMLLSVFSATVAMYISYLLLFAAFYTKRYKKKGI